MLAELKPQVMIVKANVNVIGQIEVISQKTRLLATHYKEIESKKRKNVDNSEEEKMKRIKKNEDVAKFTKT